MLVFAAAHTQAFFSCNMQWLLLLQHRQASEVVVHGLSSCGMLSPNLVALQLWDLNFPPGTEPTSPELEGGFLTTGPPRKSLVPIRNLDSTQSLVHLL